MLLLSIQQFHWIACYDTLTHRLVQRSIEYRLMMMGATLTDYSCSVFLHSMMCRFQKLHEATAEINIYFCQTDIDVASRGKVLFYLVAHLLSAFQCGFGKVAVRLLIFAEPSQQWHILLLDFLPLFDATVLQPQYSF